MDDNTYKYIQDNAVDATRDEIERAYSEQNGDILETLTVLMNISKKETLPKTDWEKRRDICDDYDTEMMKAIKQKESK